MTHRPWPIVVIALFHILAPITNFIMSAALIDMTWSEFLHHQLQNGSFELLAWTVPFLAGVALLTFQTWSYYAFLGFMVVVSLYTLRQRLLYPYRVDIWLFLLLELINFVVIIYFLSPTVKKIYFNKRIRWWQHSPRYLINLDGKASIKFAQEQLPVLTINAKILNISEGGAYIQTTETLNANDKILLQISFLNTNYEMSAQIIHAQKDGYGLLFNENVKNRVAIKQLTKILKQQKIPVRGRQLSASESFKFWLFDLLKTGHGIFPK